MGGGGGGGGGGQPYFCVNGTKLFPFLATLAKIGKN